MKISQTIVIHRTPQRLDLSGELSVLTGRQGGMAVKDAALF